MSYILQHGKTEPLILEQAKRGAFGGKVPPDIENAPSLLDGLSLFLDAFFVLDTDRSYTMGGPGPIPWSCMRAYADEYKIYGSQREDLYFHVRALDLVYLKHEAAKRPKS